MTSKMSTADLIRNVMFKFIENTSVYCFSYVTVSEEDSN
jgi:hypothetical protein